MMRLPILCCAGIAALGSAASAQEQTAEAMLAVLSDGNCVMPLSEAPAVLGSQGFTEGFVRSTLTEMVIEGAAWVDPGGVLRIDDSICPASDLAAAPPTPRAVISEGLRSVEGCAVRQGNLATLFPGADRETLTAVVRAMVADGEAQFSRFTLSVAGEGCPELMAAVVEAEMAPGAEMSDAEDEAETADPVETASAEEADAAATDAGAQDAERTEAAQTAVEAVEEAPVLPEDPTEGAPESAAAEAQAEEATSDGLAASEDVAAGEGAEAEAPAMEGAAAEAAAAEADAAEGAAPAEVAVEAAQDAPVIAGEATEGATEPVDEAVADEAASEGAVVSTQGAGAAPSESDLRAALLAEAASRDCAIRQSQIAAALPDADADALLRVVMGLVSDGSARIERFTLRLSDAACAEAGQ